MKHYFLNNDNCIERLYSDFIKHDTLIVAYDFDNTVYDYHNKGHDYSEVIELIRACHKLGFYLIVFTANTNIEFVKKYLDGNIIPYHSINENSPFWETNSRKIGYNILLDDRAGLRSAYFQLKKVIEKITDR
jgi:hydroxymethylpyrimidine pyrophosphatase-like HAD family hydrolase